MLHGCWAGQYVGSCWHRKHLGELAVACVTSAEDLLGWVRGGIVMSPARNLCDVCLQRLNSEVWL